jgi:non-homologous end joining protein Ku
MSSIRATMSNVTVAFGLVSFPVDLMPATASKRAKARTASTTLVCPTCNDAGELRPLKQRYLCEHDSDHGPFGRSDAATAIEIDGVLQAAATEAVAEVMATDTERGAIELTVHPADQVEAHTFTAGNIYRLRPKGNEAHYGLVAELARNREIAFLCEVSNKGATLLYRLIERDGVLVLTELVRPDRINETEVLPDVSFDPKLLATGEALVSSLSEPFEPAAFIDRRRARLEAMAANLKSSEPESTDTSVTDTATDLLELLRRSVDAAA